MAKLTVKDLQPNQQVTLEAMVRGNVETKIAKTGRQFAKFVIGDKSGTLDAMFFECEGRVPTSGTVYTVSGLVDSYLGKPQIKIKELKPRTTEGDEDFLIVSKFPVDEMWGTILRVISEMQSNYFARVSSDIMLEQGYANSFKTSPAATGMHHAFLSGLLEHTSQMCLTAEKLFELPFYSESLNKDLCIFGILFHDFSKMFEYDQGLGFKKTTQGILVPHIPMMGAIIYETCNKFGIPEVIRDHMMHVVLAHHGQQAWGSPVDMAIPEAAFVHYIDHLHGDIFGWLQKIEASPGEELIRHTGRTLVAKRFDEVLKSCEVVKSTDSSLSF